MKSIPITISQTKMANIKLNLRKCGYKAFFETSAESCILLHNRENMAIRNSAGKNE